MRVWRAGCIIRAALLSDITAAYVANPELPNLLLDKAFKEAVLSRQAAWREVVQTAIGLGIPMLANSASLAWFDAYRSERLPANLTQAQRDYFGAHNYAALTKRAPSIQSGKNKNCPVVMIARLALAPGDKISIG